MNDLRCVLEESRELCMGVQQALRGLRSGRNQRTRENREWDERFVWLEAEERVDENERLAVGDSFAYAC